MKNLIVPCVVLILFGFVSAQKCPSHWYGFTVNSKCYRFMDQYFKTWDDARLYCQIHGGDILKIDSLREELWVTSQINKIRERNNNNSDWWYGATRQASATQWKWADGSPANLDWAPGAESSPGSVSRCADLVGNNLHDDVCMRELPFVCWRDRSLPLTCDADHNWQTLNGACYKIYTAKKTWDEAKQQCDHDGAVLTSVDDMNEQVAFHSFAVINKQPLWIGLSALNTSSHRNWTWINGTSMVNAHWHNNPNVASEGLCVIVSELYPYERAWVTNACSLRHAFICRKPEGVCMTGWVGHRDQCYQFNSHYRLDYNQANNFCTQQGTQLMQIETPTVQMYINSYLPLLRESGITTIYIGATDNNSDTYIWSDGHQFSYTHWANDQPNNTRGQRDCVIIPTSDRYGRWQSTTQCEQIRSFVCKIPMGQTVQIPSTTPTPRYGCAPGWQQWQNLCFKVFDQPTDWSTARSQCQSITGADLVRLSSEDIQAFVIGLTEPTIEYWIGLNDRGTDGVYVWNSETSQYNGYSNWSPGQPNNLNHERNCVAMDTNQQWNDFICSDKKQYICSKIGDSAFLSTPPTTPATDWTLKCGPGWQSNPVTSFCYMFIDEPLSWLDALNECHRYDADLVSIENAREQNYIAGKVQSMSSIAVWTGANDQDLEGGWRWSSGKPFAFLNWAPGTPGDSTNGNGTDCVAMFTGTTLWADVDCNTRNGYICEKRGNVPETTPPRTTTVPVPDGMVLGCKVGWTAYDNHCYRATKAAVSWSEADLRCGKNGAKLASILTKNENDFVQGILPRPTLDWDGLWIGLSDFAIENTFQWSDGSLVTYTNWNRYEPNNYNNRNEDCVEMRIANGKWNDEICDNNRPGFVCKSPMAPVSPTQAPHEIGCPTYTKGVGAYCYRVVSGGMHFTFDDANLACSRLTKGTLATINDRIVQAYIASNLVWRHGYFWIGLSDKANQGTLGWTHGEPLEYTNWYNTHTGNEQNTCVAMRADEPIGLWENRNCSDNYFFICMSDRANYTAPQIVTPNPNVPCPDGWMSNGGHCLKGVNEKLTWLEALSYCQGLGGDLPSFHMGETDDILASIPDDIKQGTAAFWIGLNDRDTEAGHTWTDGSPVDYTNWNRDEPNDFNHAEDCVQWMTSNGKWNDISCSYSQYFVCSIPKGVTPKPVTALPTPSTSPLCGPDPAWIFYNNHCYRLSDSAGPNATLSWYEARLFCYQLDSNLVSIHTLDENEMLFGYASKQQRYPFWTGLNLLNDVDYEWTDGTPVDFQFYAPGEPNDYFGSERCVGMVDYGEWNDAHCAQKQAFICKKSTTAAPVIPSPTPYPVGGCANGFQRASGGRNKCFYLGGRNPDQRLNYTDAYAYCRRFGTGYDIASIEDMFEQQYIIQMSKGNANGFWIGLNDRMGNNRFQWQDNTPVMFTNWDKGEPTSNDPDADRRFVENCVVVRMSPPGHEGRWADLACSEQRGFICQAPQDPNLPHQDPPNNCALPGYVQYGEGCYKASAPNDRKSWHDALNACDSDGGNLVSILDIYESSFVGTLVHRNYSYWIGLSDNYIKGLYGWSDHAPVEFTNWAWREPSYDTGNFGCVMANKFGRWNDRDCASRRRYVCKIWNGGAFTRPSDAGECPDDTWRKGYEFCFNVTVNQALSWPEANHVCQSKGAQLTAVRSKDDLHFIEDLVREAPLDDPNFKPNVWIGLTRGGEQGAYHWVDGSPVNYVEWAPGEPTLLGATSQVEECVEFDRETGYWSDIDCFEKRAFVCRVPKVVPTSYHTAVVDNMTAKPPQGQITNTPNNCVQSGYVQFKQGCYKASGWAETKTWGAALRACQADGAVLASILDIYESTFIENTLVHRNYSYWIGLSDNNIKGEYGWSDNSPIIFTNWGFQEPTFNNGDNGCVMVSKTGGWNDTTCNSQRPYVCKIWNGPTPTKPSDAGDCPDPGWKKGYEFCFNVTVNQAISWADAKQACQDKDAELASIHSKDDLRYVEYLVREAPLTDQSFKPNVWIGLTLGGDQDSFHWTDGSPVNYIAWGPGQPVLQGDQTKKCVEFDRDNGYWSNIDCSSDRTFVCKKPKVSVVPTSLPSTAGCGDPAAIQGSKFCYMVTIDKPLSWPDANYMCTSRGMQLATVHSEEDLSFIQSVIRSTPLSGQTQTPNVWIGMKHDADRDIYKWTDGTTIDYKSWAPGEPTRLGPNGEIEECVQLDRDTGYWKDVNCFITQPYVCQAPLFIPGQGDGQHTYWVVTGASMGYFTGRGRSQLPNINDGSKPPNIGITGTQLGQNTETVQYGLSNGAIAAVIMCCLIVLGAAAFGILYLKKRGIIKSPPLHMTSDNMGFENAMYNTEYDAVTIDKTSDA